MRVFSFWVAASAFAGISLGQVFDDGQCLNALQQHPDQALPFCERFLHLPKTVTDGGAPVTVQVTRTRTFAITDQFTRTTTQTIPVTSTLFPVIDKRVEDVTFGVFATDVPKPLFSRQNFPFPFFLRRCGREEIVDACNCFLKLNHVPTLTTVYGGVVTHTNFAFTRTFVHQGTTQTITTYAPLATVNVGNCDVAYVARGNGEGNHVEFPLAASAADCCASCKFELNCVASAFGANGQCQHLIRDRYVFGGVVSDTCPLGSQDYDFGPASPIGNVFAGPCGF